MGFCWAIMLLWCASSKLLSFTPYFVSTFFLQIYTRLFVTPPIEKEGHIAKMDQKKEVGELW